MPKTKTVDAEAHAAAIRILKHNARYAWSLGEQDTYNVIHEVLARLAPIVPALPEGWEVTLSRPDIIKIESGICSASITEHGIIYKVWTGPDRCPHDAAEYLLHAWGMQ